MSNYALNPHVLLSLVDDGYLALDIVDEKIHHLNLVAALLVELIDGSRSTDELISLVAPHVSEDAIDAIPSWLVEAEENGLLVSDSQPESETHAREMSAEDLADLANRFRDEGKLQAAFLCQQQATQLSPKTAEYWNHLGELAHIIGKREKAKDAYQHYIELEPDDAEVRHLLTSLTDEQAPSRVPDKCVVQLYERFSSFYESNMCEELGYEGPKHLFEVIKQSIGNRKELAVLDLGCGTGLAGKALRPIASRLVGVDLSKEMLEIAGQLEIYDELQVGELTHWLDSTDELFDLIVACDTFIYFGDLGQTIGPAKKCLNPDGKIAFSVEKSSSPPFQLTDSGRYKHHIDHIRETASNCNLNVETHREEFLRMEYGDDVYAHFVCLSED